MKAPTLRRQITWYNLENIDMLSQELCETTVMQEATIKSNAHALIDQLPDNVSWSQLAYHVEVRASIERGLEDANAGRVHTTEEVKKRLGLLD